MCNSSGTQTLSHTPCGPLLQRTSSLSSSAAKLSAARSRLRCASRAARCASRAFSLAATPAAFFASASASACASALSRAAKKSARETSPTVAALCAASTAARSDVPNACNGRGEGQHACTHIQPAAGHPAATTTQQDGRVKDEMKARLRRLCSLAHISGYGSDRRHCRSVKMLP